MPVPRCAKVHLRLAIFVAIGCGQSDGATAPDAGASRAAQLSAAAYKGPAHETPLPAPGEAEYRYLDGDDAWRYVAPEHAGSLYDASYLDGRYYVLHGTVESSEKVISSEHNYLSWTQDGLAWQTITLTDQPFQSYTRLASNGHSLLLAGTRHVARLEGDSVVTIPQLEQSMAPVVLLPYAGGFVIGRQQDIVWLDDDGEVEVLLEPRDAQFRAGVARAPGQRSLLTGPLGAFGSVDGKHWSALASAPCTRCIVADVAFGNERYVAGDVESTMVSSTGDAWQNHAFEPAVRASQAPPGPLNEPGEDRIQRLDFTGGHFVAALSGGNTRLSLDGVNWGPQLKIALGQVGPAACRGRCYVAAGHILLAPFILERPRVPARADRSSPYYCEYLWPEPGGCGLCGGATVSTCREGTICSVHCDFDSDCPAAGSGNARNTCQQTQIGGQCTLACDGGEACPGGMDCVGGQCLYVFDDPRCSR